LLLSIGSEEFLDYKEATMNYWTVFKIQKGKWLYIADIDKDGNIIHTENEKEALKFRRFESAMSFFNLGYGITKH
jgi:hypothetical protein